MSVFQCVTYGGPARPVHPDVLAEFGRLLKGGRMRLKVLAVRDSAMDAFARPIFVPNVGLAVRSFRDEVNNSQGDLFKHPSDYELFELGEFDEDTGRFTNLEAPRSVARGVDCIVKEDRS